MSDILLELKGINKQIRKKQILKDVNMNINKGNICGFIGENGAGKTTVIKSITGLISINSGEILLDGNKDRIYINSNIRCLFDTPPNLNYLTAKEFLIISSNIFTGKAIYEKEIDRILQQIELLDYKYKKIHTFSLGMKKKLYLSLLLIKPPKLVILDEPMNGLDVKNIIEFKKTILKMNREYNISFLISSHLLSELESLCNEICIIQKGIIIKQDSIRNINSNKYISVTIKSNEIYELEKKLVEDIKCEILNKNKYDNSITIKISDNQCDKILKELILCQFFIKEYYINENLSEYYLKEILGG